MRVREKKNFIILIILSALLPIVELLGIGTVFGFIDLTLNLNNLEETFFSKKFKHFFLLNDPQLLIFYGGILVIIFLIFRNFFVGLNLWLKTKFGSYLSANLARRVTFGYLKFPYSFFTRNNSAILLRNINSETQILSTGYLIPLLSIFSSILVFLGVTIILTIYEIVTFVIIIKLILFLCLNNYKNF